MPAAVAGHGDPLHGVAPHSVSDRPLDIHPVRVSTPHPYELGVTYEFPLRVQGAQTLSVHFEGFALNGLVVPSTGECSGSVLHVIDGRTGVTLESFCGEDHPEDFWTADYPTDTLVLRLVTSGLTGARYGFDVYELASDGARALASVGGLPGPDVQVKTGAQPYVNPADPMRPGVSAGATLDVDAGDVRARAGTGFDAGHWTQCGFVGCDRVQGVGFDAGADVFTLDGSASAGLGLYALRTGEGPLDWWIAYVGGCGVRAPDGGPYVPCPV